SVIPKAPGGRVRAGRRDCRRLARLHRAGELVVIRVPTESEEAVRDLCRARAAVVGDRTRIRHRLSKFLLRHDRIWRQTAWTLAQEQWLTGQRVAVGVVAGGGVPAGVRVWQARPNGTVRSTAL